MDAGIYSVQVLGFLSLLGGNSLALNGVIIVGLQRI